MEHLTREQIDRYASRRAGVDEILSVAHHLDVCDECRDLAAAMVDDGSGSHGHVRKHVPAPPLEETPLPSRGHLILWIAIAAVLVVAAIAVILWVR